MYLLSEVFDYSYKQIAEFLQKSAEACRKTAQHAREAVVFGRKFQSNSAKSVRVIEKFFESATNGELSYRRDWLQEQRGLLYDTGGMWHAVNSDSTLRGA